MSRGTLLAQPREDMRNREVENMMGQELKQIPVIWGPQGLLRLVK